MQQTLQYAKRGATNLLYFDGLFDRHDRAFLANATVVATVYDPDGVPIVGATALPVSYLAGTTGADTRYFAEIPHTVTLPADGTEGTVTVTATSIAGKVGKETAPVRFED